MAHSVVCTMRSWLRHSSLILLAGAASVWALFVSVRSDPGDIRSATIRKPAALDAPVSRQESTPRPEAAHRAISQTIGRSIFDSLSPEHQALLLHRVEHRAETERPVLLCFAPGTPADIIDTFQGSLGNGGMITAQTTARWSTTATDGAGLVQGQPITLTYSFPPDATTIPVISGVSFPSGPNDLNARLDGIYGNQSVWQPIFQQVFDRWGALCGITYVFEPNDDGATMNQNPGVLGTRGDIRIGGKALDGNGSVLAYNNFPDDGDMVIDTGDNFFDVTSNQSLRLRNVVAHEHGHGIGLLHVCPANGTKLMEPAIDLSFDGPQHDDIRGAQRHYGDPSEPDDASVAATDLGTIVAGSPLTVGTVPAPAISNGATLSIDANGEEDFFKFTLSAPSLVAVTVTPVGLNYDDSPQSCLSPTGCCSGSFIDSDAIADLDIEILQADGSTVVATGNTQPTGTAEPLLSLSLPAGDHFIRIFEGDSPSESQLYTLSISFPALGIILPSGPPTTLQPCAATVLDVQILPGAETIMPGSPMLNYRYDGGAFLTSPLVLVSGDLYNATLPVVTPADAPEFFISAEGNAGSLVTDPAGGAAAPYTATVAALVLPGKQTGVSASDGSCGGGVQVSWQTMTNATSYEVWRNTINNLASAALIGTATTTSFTDNTATAQTSFLYWVRALNACGPGDFSFPNLGFVVNAAPAAPAGVTATDNSPCAITVTWNLGSTPLSYQIWRSTVNDTSTATQLATIGATAFSDSTAALGTTYFYWVTAVNACGTSGFSAAGTGRLGPGNCNITATAPSPDCGDGFCGAGSGVMGPLVLACWLVTRRRSGRLFRHRSGANGRGVA